jgi:hypothetical protein
MPAKPVSRPPSEEKQTDATASPSPLSSFLKLAGEYKEFAALIAFVVGGIFWAFAYFATKQQLKEIQCIVNANMAFVQGRMDSASLSQLMLDNLKESVTLEKATLTSDEVLKRNQLKAGANEIARKLADADNATAQALNKLKSGDCIPN